MKSDNQAGKGDRYRPVDKKKYDSNYDSISWGKKDVKDDSSNKKPSSDN